MQATVVERSRSHRVLQVCKVGAIPCGRPYICHAIPSNAKKGQHPCGCPFICGCNIPPNSQKMQTQPQNDNHI